MNILEREKPISEKPVSSARIAKPIGAGKPVPGPVLGMGVLFILLLCKGKLPSKLEAVSTTLLSNLSLLFVPAGVGVMVHLELLRSDIIPLSVAIIISTLLSIVVTAYCMSFLNKRKHKCEEA